MAATTCTTNYLLYSPDKINPKEESMHRRIVVTLAILAVSAIGMTGCKKQSSETTEAPATPPAGTAPATAPATSQPAAASGEQLFKQYCAACHPDGGNPMNPKKTLHAKDMAANNVKTSDDVVKLMRNPGAGMTKFDPSTVSDNDAKAIGDYVIATFK
jgi:cytochrome c6